MRRAQTQAATLDSRLGLRRRARIIGEDARRSWPRVCLWPCVLAVLSSVQLRCMALANFFTPQVGCDQNWPRLRGWCRRALSAPVHPPGAPERLAPPPGPRRRRRRGPPARARAQWRRQYREFAATPLGRGAFLAGVFALFYTGIAFRLLNLLVLLWWVGPLIALPLLQAASRKARARPRAPRMRRRAFSSVAAASQVCVKARLCVGCACAAAPGAAC